MTDSTRAALWMIGAIVSFTAMAVAGRELGQRFDTFEIMMYRSAFGVVFVLVVAGFAGTLHQINRSALGTHVVRNVFHFTGQNLWFFAVTTIPLAQLFALEFTTPLWVIVLSVLFLGERLTAMRAFSALLGFIGILIVARPGAAEISPGLITAALSAVFFALTYVFTKRLTMTQSITCIMFYLTFLQLIFGIITVFYDGVFTLPDRESLPFLLVVALGGLLAHFSITKALSLAPASVVAPIDFARLPVIAVIGMLLYDEPLDLLVILGAVIIFGGNYLNIWAETRKRA